MFRTYSINICNCDDVECEFYDASNDISYTRTELKQLIEQLKLSVQRMTDAYSVKTINIPVLTWSEVTNGMHFHHPHGCLHENGNVYIPEWVNR